MKVNVVGFTEDAKDEILGVFGKIVTPEGYIVEADSKRPVFTPDGEQIKRQSFAGITKGSEIFIKSDIVSLISLADRLRGNNVFSR